MAGEIPVGAGPAGGLPTAPSIGGGQAALPQPGAAQPPGQPGLAPEQGAVPVPPDGGTQVTEALSTLMKFALAQREQGNEAIAQLLQPLVEMIAGAGQPQMEQPVGAAPGLAPEVPQGIPTPQPVAGGNVPLNA